MKNREERVNQRGARHHRTRAAAVVALAALPLGFAGPASAEQPLLIHFTDHDELVLGNDECVPFPLLFTHHGTGTFRLLRHGGEEFYGANTFNQTDVWTNLENGRSFTLTAHGVDKDLHVSDNGSGVLTIDAFETGSFQYRGPDGKMVLHDAGPVSFTVVVDTQGTPEPDDDVELSHATTGVHGLIQTADRDFCADLIEQIG